VYSRLMDVTGLIDLSTTACRPSAGGGLPSESLLEQEPRLSQGYSPELFAGHRPEQLAGLHAVNLLIVRAAFDLLRSQKFHDVVKRRLQIKLANINVPHYVTPLRLEGLNLGNVPPMIKRAYSLPSPSHTLIPRLVMHVVYSGRCSLVVQTNVDLKDSPGLVGLEKTQEELLLAPSGASPYPSAGSGLLQNAEREFQEQVSGISLHSTASTASGSSAASATSKRSGVVRSYQSLKNIMSGGANWLVFI
jgi:hypothetical protein